ncbi:hypothetical protein Hypma_014259 [Hypsizygus marmoreus]|uniref:Uncharacterized protein n=1 Tax=Hypsizygus marmoreus TaxID=39966 RepID=A0A369JHB9_HYPMA|nr:hypothetical protein Hypma_014259 [Hypsizygus marmoreus]
MTAYKVVDGFLKLNVLDIPTNLNRYGNRVSFGKNEVENASGLLPIHGPPIPTLVACPKILTWQRNSTEYGTEEDVTVSRPGATSMVERAPDPRGF